jgi:RsiW-degrading membrane proteinase PrsW (M82 family)
MIEEIRTSFWRSGLAVLLGLVAFVILMGVLPQDRLQGTPLLGAGVILALVPALLWLAFFHLQDRNEAEPKRIVFRVFLAGALFASGVGLPIVRDFLRVEEWLQGSIWLRLVGTVLAVGFTQEFLKYAALRYTVFPTSEFHNRIDGILYGVAAGLGYATVLNLDYVLAHQGVVLFVGAIQMVDTAVAQAGFSAITGYFLAGAKYGQRPIWWVPAGLTTAAALNGLFTTLRQEVSVRGLSYQPLYALVLSIAFVTVALAVLFAVISRARWRTASQREKGEPAESHVDSQPIEWETSLRRDAVVIVTIVLALIAGLTLKSLVLHQRVTFTDADAHLSLQYPAWWALSQQKGQLLSVQDLRSQDAFKPTFSVEIRELEPETTRPVQEMVVPFTVERGQELTGYRVLEIAETRIDGEDAAQITYIYVDYGAESHLQSALPVVVKAVDVLVIHQGKLYAFEAAAPAATFAQQSSTLDDILKSVDLEA